MVLIDLQKAFDPVDHCILLQELGEIVLSDMVLYFGLDHISQVVPSM